MAHPKIAHFGKHLSKIMKYKKIDFLKYSICFLFCLLYRLQKKKKKIDSCLKFGFVTILFLYLVWWKKRYTFFFYSDRSGYKKSIFFSLQFFDDIFCWLDKRKYVARMCIIYTLLFYYKKKKYMIKQWSVFIELLLSSISRSVILESH